jgi:hypothetical protein
MQHFIVHYSLIAKIGYCLRSKIKFFQLLGPLKRNVRWSQTLHEPPNKIPHSGRLGHIMMYKSLRYINSRRPIQSILNSTNSPLQWLSTGQISNSHCALVFHANSPSAQHLDFGSVKISTAVLSPWITVAHAHGALQQSLELAVGANLKSYEQPPSAKYPFRSTGTASPLDALGSLV